METALVIAAAASLVLALLALVLAVACAVLAASVPWLWWKAFRLEAKVEALDEVVDQTLRAAGLGEPEGPLPPPADGQAAAPSNGWATSRPVRGTGPMNEVG